MVMLTERKDNDLAYTAGLGFATVGKLSLKSLTQVALTKNLRCKQRPQRNKRSGKSFLTKKFP